MKDDKQFDWADKESIVVRRVDPIAIYKNTEGDIVIRQQRADDPDDAIITIPPQQLHFVIEGLQAQLSHRWALEASESARASAGGSRGFAAVS